MNQRAFEIVLLRSQLIELLVLAVVLGITIAVWYFVMKAAIRDGIKESGIVHALSRVAGATPALRDVRDLPDMRAER